MLTNAMKAKALVEVKTSTRTSLGETASWDEVGSYWCRRVPVDVATKTAYQQQNTVVTDKFVFEGKVDLKYNINRLTYEGDLYNLIESAQFLEGSTIVLAVKA